MEFTSYVVDECGTPITALSNLSDKDLEIILDEHPEYSVKCL